jgi:hypothetical protein
VIISLPSFDIRRKFKADSCSCEYLQEEAGQEAQEESNEKTELEEMAWYLGSQHRPSEWMQGSESLCVVIVANTLRIEAGSKDILEQAIDGFHRHGIWSKQSRPIARPKIPYGL